jgi:molybdopterin-biosynthesis enzyme MoeA-like protein
MDPNLAIAFQIIGEEVFKGRIRDQRIAELEAQLVKNADPFAQQETTQDGGDGSTN